MEIWIWTSSYGQFNSIPDFSLDPFSTLGEHGSFYSERNLWRNQCDPILTLNAQIKSTKRPKDGKPYIFFLSLKEAEQINTWLLRTNLELCLPSQSPLSKYKAYPQNHLVSKPSAYSWGVLFVNVVICLMLEWKIKLCLSTYKSGSDYRTCSATFWDRLAYAINRPLKKLTSERADDTCLRAITITFLNTTEVVGLIRLTLMRFVALLVTSSNLSVNLKSRNHGSSMV